MKPETTWLELGEGFHDVVVAARFPQLVPRFSNHRAAAEVGLEDLDFPRHCGRLEPLPGSLSEPLALRYHGHQFRMYNPDLGDGRGFLLAQLRDAEGRLLDLGTKGSGTTPYSRGGDGRLTLKGAFREVLAAELLEARGVPTCRILSVFETGEDLVRYDEPSPTRSAVMVRLSWSHVRFGSFQRLAYRGLADEMERLVAYCCAHLVEEAADARELLAAVTARVADCAGAWMAAGYVHGVLNTDNLNVTGESFDYGPFRWLIQCEPAFTAAYFDSVGLYSYGRQPGQVEWALHRLAEALSLVADKATLKAELRAFPGLYRRAVEEHFTRRLGVSWTPGTAELLASATTVLAMSGTPFDQLFHDWRGGLASRQRALEGPYADVWRSTMGRRLQDALDGHAAVVPLDHPHLERATPLGLPIDKRIHAMGGRPFFVGNRGKVIKQALGIS